MKAAVYERYGLPDVLKVRDVDVPAVRDTDVLVRVRAASVNMSDWEGLRGRPFYARMQSPFRPRVSILGTDVAGVVEEVGAAVEAFRPGDEVLADVMWHGGKTFAEYVRIPVGAPLVPKPAGLSFVVAAALPQSGVIAMQGLDGVESGSTVMINGAGGGAGTLALQIAQHAGATVTAVDNGHKRALLESMGADVVVDYTKQKASQTGRRYDVILDLAAHRSVVHYLRSLNPGGRYRLVGGSMSALLQAATVGQLFSLASNKQLGVLMVKTGKEALQSVVDLVGADGMTPVIDTVYPLAEVAEAMRHHGEGRALGKVVIATEAG